MEPQMAEPHDPVNQTTLTSVRALRRAMCPQIDRLSAEVWFADYPFRQDPDAVRRERADLVAFLAGRGVPAEADDELANSPAVQLLPTNTSPCSTSAPPTPSPMRR